MILAAEARLGRATGLGTVFCTFCNGVLTLSGYVATVPLRQLASKIAEGLDGVDEVRNEVVVTGSWHARPRHEFPVQSGLPAFAC